VLTLARVTGRVLLTFDKDCGELVYKQGLPPSPGIVFFRLERQEEATAGDLLLAFLDVEPDSIEGSFTIITRTHIRRRPLP
jgi:hypothetical protein